MSGNPNQRITGPRRSLNRTPSLERTSGRHTSVYRAGVGLEVVLLSVMLCACSQIPTSGPSESGITGVKDEAASAIQVVDVDDGLARKLLAQTAQQQFSSLLGNVGQAEERAGAGDVVGVSIWEASPPALFLGAAAPGRPGQATGSGTALPDQVVSREGDISVPFAGHIAVAGRTTHEIEAEVARRLAGKANHPEVMVRLVRNVSSNVTVVGEVTNSTRMAITPNNEHLLDAIAAAAGVRQPVNKVTIQIARAGRAYAMPLEGIIRDPSQNVRLQPGDVITAYYQPLSFTVLGATGKNEEINFEAQGISLAQALARAGGMLDARSDPRGVFVFRFEDADALEWPRKPVQLTASGKVPVIYRVDLAVPSSLFAMQDFMIRNRDLVYVSNAPITELQKFLNVVFSVVYPLTTTTQTFK